MIIVIIIMMMININININFALKMCVDTVQPHSHIYSIIMYN